MMLHAVLPAFPRSGVGAVDAITLALHAVKSSIKLESQEASTKGVLAVGQLSLMRAGFARAASRSPKF